MRDPNDRRAYRPSDLAERWGCSKSAVHELIKQKRLPAFTIGGRLFRVHADTVDGLSNIQEARRRYPSPDELPESPEVLARLMQRKMAYAGPPDGGFVYFMRCREIVKIGYSVEPVRRRGELQDHIPFDLDLLGYVASSAKAERALHSALAAIRHNRLREWFVLTPTLEGAISLIIRETESNV
jgi:excisionase family DNA binding protein